jgi:WD40 repeat protein
MLSDRSSRSSSNPFKGLAPFGGNDQHILFGRDQDFTLMRERVYAGRTTLLFAASGVGKTSFLKARLLPKLSNEFVICYHNAWADEEPVNALLKSVIHVSEVPSSPGARSLSAAVSGFRRASQPDPLAPLQLRPARTRPRDLLLVLDQFEEVFQYYGFRNEFTEFLQQISEVINDHALCVRVVFSMRDDFLGRLSVFDNRIPDLFNNYYRLKSPTVAQAREIIQRTVATLGEEVDSEGLIALTSDLSLFTRASTKNLGPEPQRSPLSRIAARLGRIGSAVLRVVRAVFPIGGERPPKTESVRGGFVVPPYMQIVCRELWARWTGQRGGRFLHDYRSSGNPAVNNSLGILRQFCRHQLGQLQSERERDLAAHAFQYLMTREGAKMAYQRYRLAQHMHVKSRELEPVLNTLYQNGILRRFKGVDDSYWYELYHDMYAPILSDWRFEHDLKRNARRRGWTIGWVAAAMVLSLWAASVFRHRTLIAEARDAYPVRSYDALRKRVTLGLPIPWLERFANAPWAAYWDRRAIRAEAAQDRDRAILLRLMALAARSTPERLLAVDRLTGGDYAGNLRLTLHGPGTVTSMAFSPDDAQLAAVTADGAGRIWDVATGQETGSFAVGEILSRGDEVVRLDFVRNGTIVTITRDRSVAVWQSQGESKEWEAQACADNATAYAVDAAAHRFAVSARRQVEETQLPATGRLVCSYDFDQPEPAGAPPRSAPADEAVDLQYGRNDSELLVIRSDGHVSSVSVGATAGSRRPILNLPVATPSRQPIGISPDGQYIAAVWGERGGTFQLFNDRGMKVGPATPVRNSDLSEVTFSRDGNYVSVSQSFSGEEWLFDGHTGQPQQNILPAWSSKRTLAPNFRLAATAGDGMVWVSTADSILRPVFREPVVTAVAFNSTASAFATAATGGAIRLWHPAPSEPLTEGFRLRTPGFAAGVDSSRSCAFSEDTDALHVEHFGGETWQIPTAGDTGRVIAAPGCRAFAKVDTTNRLWLWRHGRPAIQLQLPTDGGVLRRRIGFVARFSPDGSRLVAWQRSIAFGLKGIVLWDARTGERIVHLPEGSVGGPRSGLEAVFTADSQTLVTIASSDMDASQTAVRLLSSKDGKLLWDAQLPGAMTSSVVVSRSPAGLVAIATSAGAHLIDVAGRRSRRVSSAETSQGIDDMNFDDSGQRLAVIDQGTLTIHDVGSGPPQPVVFGEPFVTTVFNPQYAHLAIAVSDRGCQLFDIRAGSEPAPVGPFIFFPQASAGSADQFPTLEFTHDGKAVILANGGWMHKLAVTDAGLVFEQSRLLSAPLQTSDSFAVLDPAGDTVKAWLDVGDRASRLETVDFRPNAGTPGASSGTLEEWQRKVGLRLENGQIFARETRRPGQF